MIAISVVRRPDGMWYFAGEAGGFANVSDAIKACAMASGQLGSRADHGLYDLNPGRLGRHLEIYTS